VEEDTESGNSGIFLVGWLYAGDRDLMRPTCFAEHAGIFSNLMSRSPGSLRPYSERRPNGGAGPERSERVKYVLLIYDNPEAREAFFGERGNELMGEIDALVKELTESAELVSAEALADPSNTKTVRVRDGVPAVTDGPFAEAKEQLGGYLIVDCESPERAAEIAARWPNARYCAMEVRPIMEEAGTEM
jgi:hypothetical protein